NRSQHQPPDAAEAVDCHTYHCPSLLTLTQRRLGRFRRGLGRDLEMLIDILGRPAGAERMHADEAAIGADIAVPTLADTRFDRDLDGAWTQHLFTILRALFLEQ